MANDNDGVGGSRRALPQGMVSGAALRLEMAARGFPMTDADAPPRSLWRRLRGAFDGMVAGWRGEAWWQE